MTTATDTQSLDSVFAPHLPICSNSRLLLLAIRRMASGGINDAHAAHLLFATFGLGHRRLLILLRAFMLEMSRVSKRPIIVAPGCCQRVTRDEQTILEVIASATKDVHQSHSRLSGLLSRENCLGTLSSAQAIGTAFADLGRPLALS